MDLDKKPLHLWYAYPEDLLSEGAADACSAMLSEDERIRWQRFRFGRDRREFLATRVLVRLALSHYRATAPQAWRFSRNQFGKPAIEPDCGLRFNLANANDLVACIISEGAEVGIDVEPHARNSQIAELAPSVFSPLELAQLDALSAVEKLDRALSLWTLKEAYIKARGMGLSLPLQGFSFLFGGAEGIRLELDPGLCDKAGRWQFCLLEHAGHRTAVMTEMEATRDVQIWEIRPLLASPTRLAGRVDRWFPALPPVVLHR